LIKVAERRATLLGLNPVLGHAVKIVQHEPVNKPTSTDKIEAALNALLTDQAKNGSDNSRH
jgi:hypothetical protein